jgi:hypothetical protein
MASHPSSKSPNRCRVFAIAMLVCGASMPASSSVAQPLAELQVKAAFLFNFAKFVTWPAADRPLGICVAGNPALTAAATELVRGRAVDGRSVVARTVAASGPTDGCDVLYLADIKADDASAMLSRLRGPVLTVGETTRFLRDGGMVRMFVDGNRMRFQVSQKQAEAAGLKISSQLLLLASQ